MQHYITHIFYIDLITSISGECVPLEQVDITEADKFYSIRHDIDNLSWFPLALRMAEIEYRNNMHTTYCVINSDPLFFTENTIVYCKKLMDLGHYINLHLDVVVPYVSEKTSISHLIRNSLSFLREGGIPVTGVSAHGNPETYEYGFNYEFWEEFDPSKYQGVGKTSFEKIALSNFGLTYETTFIGHDAYLSDKGSSFLGYFLNDYDVVPFDSPAFASKQNIGLGVIDRFNSLNRGFLQMNIHPYHKRWFYEK